MKPNEFYDFFHSHSGEDYLKNCFTQNTANEVEFLLEVLNLNPGDKILDLGCGPGRHSIELAKKGFDVVGVDFSEVYLKTAKERAEDAGVNVEFICRDAREFIRMNYFDGAICICEGAFGLLERDNDNLRILRNIADSMEENALFVLTTLNGYAAIRSAPKENSEDNWFDPIHCTNSAVIDVAGKKYQGIERAYIVPELLKMHAAVGLDVLHVYGGTAGNWGRRPLDIDEMEVMLISKKV
jgi:cyclopropane fatty-acyl-phospholipid synthase-like methyltransferase